jgi:hypothetical protein
MIRSVARGSASLARGSIKAVKSLPLFKTFFSECNVVEVPPDALNFSEFSLVGEAAEAFAFPIQCALDAGSSALLQTKIVMFV